MIAEPDEDLRRLARARDLREIRRLGPWRVHQGADRGLGEGKADLLHNGSVTVSELDAYIAEQVKALTEGRQHPVMSRPNTIPDFAFAVVR